MATPRKSTLQEIFDRKSLNIKDAAVKSRSWFDKQVADLAKERLTPKKVMSDDTKSLRNVIIPGDMYFFMYDAKNKQTLPYWDRFPLVLPYAKVENGFMGLNLHYIPYQLRVPLLNNLMIFKNNDRMDHTTRIKYSWEMINGVSRYAAAQPCIKHYLMDHLRSPLKKVHSSDWVTAMLMPVENFVGATTSRVWTDSRRIIRNA